MKIWVVQYHHWHGVDAWPVASDEEPDLGELEKDLVEAGDTLDLERDEYLEVGGPWNFPGEPIEPAVR